MHNYHKRRIGWFVLFVILVGSITWNARPLAAQDDQPPSQNLILSGEINLPPTVYVFAQSSTSFGIYFIEDSTWQLVTSVPVNAVTVDSVKAKLSPDGTLVAYLVTDGNTGDTALYTTNLFGMHTRLLYGSPNPALAVTSFAWHGNDQVTYTLTRGPFAGAVSDGTAINLTEQAAASSYAGEIWLSSTDGVSQTQVISQTAGVVLGSVDAATPIYYTFINTETQQLVGLNSIAGDGSVKELFRNQIDAAGQGTIYTSFELAQIAPGETKIAMIAASDTNLTMPEHGTRLLTADLDGANVNTVLTDTADLARAVWSPDGNKIAYVRGSTGVLTVRDLNDDSTSTFPNAVQSTIQWDAAGEQVATLAALDTNANPFTTGFALQSLDGTVVASASTQAAANTAFSRFTVPGSVPYVHQKLDTPANFTGKNSSCGSTSVVMALGYLGKIKAPYGERVPEFHPAASFGREPAEGALRDHGIDQRGGPPYSSYNTQFHVGTLQGVVNALERNHLVIAGTKLTSAGHIVVIIGYERAGNDVRLIVNDSWGNANLSTYGTRRDGENVVYTWEKLGFGWGIEVNATADTVPPADPNTWRAEYFNSRNLAGNPIIRNDTAIDFDWGGGSPDGRINNDNFSARWRRTINISQSGVYRFSSTFDDGMRILIDGRVILDQWGIHAPTRLDVDVYLSAGNHTICVEYFEADGGAVARVSWNFIPPPTTSLYVAAEYFDQPNHQGNRITEVLNSVDKIWYWWGPHYTKVWQTQDNFSTRFSWPVSLRGGDYRICISSDDGFRFFVDGGLRINSWSDRNYETCHTVNIGAGRHTFRLDHYEHLGWASVRMTWGRADGTWYGVARPSALVRATTDKYDNQATLRPTAIDPDEYLSGLTTSRTLF